MSNVPFEVRDLPDVPASERRGRDQQLLREAKEFMRRHFDDVGSANCVFVTEKDVYVARWIALKLEAYLAKASRELREALSSPVSIVSTFDSLIYSYIVFRALPIRELSS